MTVETGSLVEAIDHAVARLDFDRLHQEYWEQNEFLVIKQFLPRTFVEEVFVPKPRPSNPS